MSNVSNRHTVEAFTAGKSTALTGQRLAKVGWKSSKNKAALFSSICVSVPFIQKIEEQEMQALRPHLLKLLEDTQDSIIRSIYESKEGNVTSFSDDELGVSACIGYLNAESEGDRLTKDKIISWFDSEVAENLTVVVAEKLGFAELTDQNLPTVEKHVKIYRDVLSMLAGGKTLLNEKQRKGCKTAIALASDEGEVGQKLLKRIASMETPKQEISLLDL